MLDAKIPAGPLPEKWTDYKGHCKLVNPSNKRKLEVIIVGTGLAGASAAASLAELGYQVKAFCFQDSPRRAHSIAAQGAGSRDTCDLPHEPQTFHDVHSAAHTPCRPVSK